MALLFIFTFIVLGSDRSRAQGSPEESIVKSLEAYYLIPEKRHPDENVTITGDQARIVVWRDLPENPEPQITECYGYRFLLSGRGERMGFGAADVFKKFPVLKRVTLDLIDLDFSTKGVDGRGTLKRTTQPRRYLSMTAERAAVETKTSLKKTLWDSLPQCLSVGRSLIRIKEITL